MVVKRKPTRGILDITHRSGLPPASGIYLVLNQENGVEYVGQSKKLKARWDTQAVQPKG